MNHPSCSATAGAHAPGIAPLYGAADWLAKQAFLVGGREAMVDAATRLTYRQLDERVTRLARVLRDQLGIARLDRVAVLARSGCVTWLG
jgi:acyl-CoA synthetase (AMP-forming)/AMP-acid ligase II